ncbi:redoxin domain-containing protein [Virgibacillus kimchii]
MKLRERIPELAGATQWLNSNEIHREELIGSKPVLIHFWSVSCDLCKRSIPRVQQLRDKYKDELVVIAVHMPRSKEDLDLNLIKETAASHSMTEPIYVDGEEKLTKTFSNRQVPSFYLFDGQGTLRYIQKGSGSVHMLKNRLERLLK